MVFKQEQKTYMFFQFLKDRGLTKYNIAGSLKTHFIKVSDIRNVLSALRMISAILISNAYDDVRGLLLCLVIFFFRYVWVSHKKNCVWESHSHLLCIL